MKHLRPLLHLGAALLPLFAVAQTKNVAINNSGALPANNALLDISSTTKGVLIPRVPNASALPATDGLTVYQTNAPKGFYYSQGGTWLLIGPSGGTNWDLAGNVMSTVTAPALTHPNPDFFGTTDNTDVVFRSNNVERVRIKATSGFVGVGSVNPQERLEVNGGLRIHQPLSASNAALYSATSSAGTMAYYAKKTNPAATTTGFYVSTPAPTDTLLWTGHWGNITGVGPSAVATANGTSGGWRRLVNDYDEAFNKAWTHHRVASCVTGTAEVPRPTAAASTSTLTLAEATRVSPFLFTDNAASTLPRRFRKQFVYTATEIDPERNQLAPGGDVSAVEGLCRNALVDRIAFYIEPGVAAPVSTLNATSYWTVTVKNVPVGLGNTASLTGFDNGIDPLQGCGSIRFGGTTFAAGGWAEITLQTPFRWNGVGGVLVEVAGLQFTSGASPIPHVRVQSTGAVARSYAAYTLAAGGPPNSACFPSTALNTGTPCFTATDYSNNLADACGTFGNSFYRPLVRFGGQVAHAPLAQTTSGTGNFLLTNGAFISEVPVATGAQPWGRQTTPYYSLKGPGTISAQRGIFDEGIRLNDHVFDRAFDGRVAADDAADFGAQRTLSIAEMAEHTRNERHLPTIKGREEWNAEGGFSLGDLTNQLWVTTETQALYLTDLHDRLNALEALSNDRPLQAKEAANARKTVCTMPELSDAEKARLAQQLKDRTIIAAQPR
ncbi:MAG TPA: hypothetical protein VGE21_16555 [Flavobacteriales bacterium]